MGKLESSPNVYRNAPQYLPWHAHITALTVAPSARRLGLAKLLTESLEKAGDEFNAWFVDLFVRESNQVAISMYKGMGYVFFSFLSQMWPCYCKKKVGESHPVHDCVTDIAFIGVWSDTTAMILPEKRMERTLMICGNPCRGIRQGNTYGRMGRNIESTRRTSGNLPSSEKERT